ncbi:hypothetical protein CC86DRAFT_299705 [Ophiobolus disseminans]|uniref:Uncharacterized protein n=1 Tax=Ophiobolus disseminans TaxID=1469910 RepID=A0A6A6ZPX7_9PLEO|nr:hypothetical protein CC86DRAFT_299705 [Ophiobolus disseminans]
MFKPLSSAYSGQVAGFMERCQGLTSMSKRDFYLMFIAAWEASFKEETILKAFEATGVLPLNPEVILKKFHTSQPTQGSSSNSDSSALSASNWKITEGLLQQVVKNRDDPQAQKLSKAFHSISVQKMLLEQETQGLKEALIHERRRRKRGKPRQAKAQATQARREARAEVRIVREKEKAKKAAEKASRAAACRTQQQLQNALKATQKGNKMRPKAATKATQKKLEFGEASGAAAGQEPSQSRHGRAIKLPAKYR